MKKIVSFVVSVLLCIGVFSGTCFAAELSPVTSNNEVVTEVVSEDVQPRLVTNYEYNGYVQLTLTNEFAVNTKGNLHLVFGSSAPCRIKVYQKGVFGWNEIFSTNHSGNATNYTVKTNAPTGTYKYEIYTDVYNCYVSMQFVTSQYA